MKDFEKVPKNRWVRLIRKRWFLPAVYITIAGLILSVVVWYQTFGNPWMNSSELRDEIEQMDEHFASDFDEEAQSVLQQQETIQMPIEEAIEAEIITKFYDYDATEEDQEKGLTLYNSRYYQSTGIDIAQANGETFNVVASLSGTVTEVKEDPLLGNVVTISHGDSITTHYASLDEVLVDVDTKIKQGDKLGNAGKNIFNESSGMHLHFELHKNGVEVDPEQFFNEQVSKLEDLDVEVTDMDDGNDQDGDDDKDDEKEKPEEKPEKNEQGARKGTNEEVSFSMTT